MQVIREGHIIPQALATAVTVLEQLPFEHRPVSDIGEMHALLRLRCGDAAAESLLQQAERRLKVLLDQAVQP